MQYPSTRRVVPKVDYCCRETIQALVEFNEGRYSLPERFGQLAHQVLLADALGDDNFVEETAKMLKVPVDKIISSNRPYDVRMAIRDKLRLSETVPQLEVSVNCFICKYNFVEPDLTVLSPCCGRRFHHSCLLHCRNCLYCTRPWAGLPCTVCNRPTSRKGDRTLYRSFVQLVRNHKKCCGVDVHASCSQFVCPKCGETAVSETDYSTFVSQRQEQRRNDTKRS